MQWNFNYIYNLWHASLSHSSRMVKQTSKVYCILEGFVIRPVYLAMLRSYMILFAWAICVAIKKLAGNSNSYILSIWSESQKKMLSCNLRIIIMLIGISSGLPKYRVESELLDKLPPCNHDEVRITYALIIIGCISLYSYLQPMVKLSINVIKIVTSKYSKLRG